MCTVWQNKPLVNNTWATFKVNFTQAENDKSKITAKETGYANCMTKEEMDKYIIIKVKLRVIFKKQSTFIYYKPNII